MRKSAFILAITAFILFGCKSGEKHEQVLEGPIETVNPKPDGHTSRTSLDWAGIYQGTTPCADCEGIETTVELKTDKTFVLTQNYLGQPGGEGKFKESGNFTWNDDGSSITLETSDHVIKFKVGENELRMLDMSGNVVSGALANFYVLKKK